MAVLLFAGVDKVGKTTLFQAVLKNTNRHICVDRFTPCQWVYGNHHNKDAPPIEYLREVEVALEDYAGVVYVEAFLEDIVKRFEEHNEKDIEIEDIEKVMGKYREYINDTDTLPVLYINTSIGTIEECMKDIVRFGDWIDTGEESVYDEVGPGRILLKPYR
jgi:hypothetical protein